MSVCLCVCVCCKFKHASAVGTVQVISTHHHSNQHFGRLILHLYTGAPLWFRLGDFHSWFRVWFGVHSCFSPPEHGVGGAVALVPHQVIGTLEPAVEANVWIEDRLLLLLMVLMVLMWYCLFYGLIRVRLFRLSPFWLGFVFRLVSVLF